MPSFLFSEEELAPFPSLLKSVFFAFDAMVFRFDFYILDYSYGVLSIAGMKEVGLFRLSGLQSRVKELKDAFNSGKIFISQLIDALFIHDFSQRC
jgi:hypothetical protein